MKTGIITLYYKSTNYGGLLQAYAMIKKLNILGYEAEQICIGDFVENKSHKKRGIRKYFRLKNYVKFLKIKLSNIIRKMHYKEIESHVKLLQDSFINFRENIIPNSKKVYDDKNINECLDEYDVFITGSDQVWNFNWFKSAYFLDFVKGDIPKFAYAASFGGNVPDKDMSEVLKESLKDYQAVSLREDKSLEYVKKIYSGEVEFVADPTLLLRKQDWENICSERIIEDDYIFCYFLGDNKKSRKIAKKYAKNHNFKLVFIPYFHGVYESSDKNMGDIRLSEVSPEDFLSLIKYSRAVFTDSFHATVFSHIFKKDYFVFKRNKAGSMGERLESISNLFESEDRLCFSKQRENIEYIENLKSVNYDRTFEKLEDLIKKSELFLERNLEKAENTIKLRNKGE